MKVHRVVADPMPGLAALLELISDPLDFDELLSIRAITDPVARETQAILKLVRPPIGTAGHAPEV